MGITENHPRTGGTTTLRSGRLLVGGEWRPSQSGRVMQIHSPATGEVIANVPEATAADVDTAVTAARKALSDPNWSQMQPSERGKLVNHLADLIERNLEELFELETLNNGRPIHETRAQLARVPEFFRYNAALAIARRDHVIPVKGEYLNYTRRGPVGVVANISPFNHPLAIACRNLAPTFASGCTTVLKPSEYTPLTALRVAEIFAAGGLPPGVLNVVTGHGAEAGNALSEHPGINKLVLTGGTETGRSAGAAAARNFASQTLELGGKTPVLVFDDYDVDQAVSYAMFGSFVGAGQTCVCSARHIVHRSIYKEFIDKLGARARQIRVGDPFDPATQMGPVISERQRRRILEYVKIGLDEGATLVAGGRIPPALTASGGFFVEPTVFGNVTPAMRIAREEIFGPFTVVIPFETEEEAIRIANDSPYGLAGAVRTNDITRAHRVADRLDVGIVWINDHHRIDPASPWGGVKLSGIGREYGEEAFSQYFTVKSVMVNLSSRPLDWFGSSDRSRLN
jgi:acyl-CoA reductase-like NAD-dependent aldehyde dehydrogenase